MGEYDDIPMEQEIAGDSIGATADTAIAVRFPFVTNPVGRKATPSKAA